MPQENCESIEIAKIDARSANQRLEELAFEIAESLDKGDFRIVDLSTILSDGNHIIVQVYDDTLKNKRLRE